MCIIYEIQEMEEKAMLNSTVRVNNVMNMSGALRADYWYDDALALPHPFSDN